MCYKLIIYLNTLHKFFIICINHYSIVGACPSCKFWTGLIRDGDNFVLESSGTPIPLDGLDGLDMTGVSNEHYCVQMRFENNGIYLMGASCDEKSVYICQIVLF